MKGRRVAASILVLLLAVACSTGCNPQLVQNFTEPKMLYLYEARTTKADVSAVIGEPDKTEGRPYRQTQAVEYTWTYHTFDNWRPIHVILCNTAGTCGDPEIWPGDRKKNRSQLTLKFLDDTYVRSAESRRIYIKKRYGSSD